MATITVRFADGRPPLQLETSPHAPVAKFLARGGLVTKSPPPHGELGRYKYWGCRCERCRRAERGYAKRQARGLQPPAFMPLIQPMREVQALQAIGVGIRPLAVWTGLPREVLQQVAHGQRNDRRGGVRPDTAQKIHKAYLHFTEEPDRTGAGAARARTHARKMGYYPPEAWTDETIRDPKARPYAWRPLVPEGVDSDKVESVLRLFDVVPVSRSERKPAVWGRLRPAERIWIMQTLTDQGMSFNRIALNLGVGIAFLKVWIGRRDLGVIVQSGGVTRLRFHPDASLNQPQRMPKRRRVSLVKASPARVSLVKASPAPVTLLDGRPARQLLEVAA